LDAHWQKRQYPSAIVSDGTTTLTLWRVADPASAVAFDRRGNVGLHHLAFAVADEAALQATFEKVSRHPGVMIEFAPGPYGLDPNGNTSSVPCQAGYAWNLLPNPTEAYLTL
jgi:hypothetical protein